MEIPISWFYSPKEMTYGDKPGMSLTYENAVRVLKVWDDPVSRDNPKDVIASAAKRGIAIMRTDLFNLWVMPVNKRRTQFRIRVDDKLPF